MTPDEIPPCVACGIPAIGRAGPSNQPRRIHVPHCGRDECSLPDWWSRTCAQIERDAGNCAVPISDLDGLDLAGIAAFWQRHAAHEARLQDGICPNGCALMVETTDPATTECPACHFTLHRRTI